MDRSAILAQALQAMGAPAQSAASGAMDPAAMLRVKQQRAAFEAENPGKSYALNGLHQLGQAVGFGRK